jgi:hypothetical protein
MKTNAASAADFSLSPNIVSVARKKAFLGPGSDKKKTGSATLDKGVECFFSLLTNCKLEYRT